MHHEYTSIMIQKCVVIVFDAKPKTFHGKTEENKVKLFVEFYFYCLTVTSKVFPLQARLWPRLWVEIQLFSSMTAILEGGEWSAALPSLFTPGKDPIPIVQQVVWTPGPDRKAGKSRPTGIRSPDPPARSQLLYRLCYPAHISKSVH